MNIIINVKNNNSPGEAITTVECMKAGCEKQQDQIYKPVKKIWK